MRCRPVSPLPTWCARYRWCRRFCELATTRYDPDLHKRRSIRVPGYDYASPGAYSVTICVRDRECLLGDVVDGTVVLNDVGRIVRDSWVWLDRHHPYVTLDEWVVMPNHLHGIIVITDDSECRGGSRTAPTGSDCIHQTDQCSIRHPRHPLLATWVLRTHHPYPRCRDCQRCIRGCDGGCGRCG